MRELMTLTPLRRLSRLSAALALVAAMAVAVPAGPAVAQNLFEPVIYVNDQAITRYELQQRARMLQLFRAPGDPRELAREQLIEDRIKMEAAESAGVSLPDEAIRSGMEEFAGRADMGADAFVAQLEQAGVSEQTFRAFVRSGITWREYTRARFAPRVSVSDADLERATQALTGGSAVRVLLSEIILPIRNAEEAAAQQGLAQRISNVESEARFAAFAREHSAAQTARQGGRMNWTAASDLPEGLRQIVLAMAPGEVSDPLPIEGGLALVYLRDIREGVHVAGAPGEMHGQDGPRARGDCGLHALGIDVLGYRVDIREHGLQTGMDDGIDRGAKGHGRGNHLVARVQAGGQ